MKRSKEGVLMTFLYVDDLLLASKNRSQTSWMKKKLSIRFYMKELSEAKVCLPRTVNEHK